MLEDDLFPSTLPLPHDEALPAPLQALTREQRDLAVAFALGALPRPRTWLYTLLAELGARDDQGRRYTSEHVRELMLALHAAGHIAEQPSRPGSWRLTPELDNAVLAWVLDHPQRADLAAALESTEKVHGHNGKSPPHFGSPEAAVAVLRLSLFAGDTPQALARWHGACRWLEWNELISVALSTGVDEALLQRLHPVFRAHTLTTRLAHVLLQWEALPDQALPELATALLASGALPDDLQLRMTLVEYLVASNRLDEVPPLLQPLREPPAPAPKDHEAQMDAHHARALAQGVDAALLALRGRWAEAEAAYDTALAELK